MEDSMEKTLIVEIKFTHLLRVISVITNYENILQNENETYLW